MNAQRVLITGGAGFIGSALTRHCIAMGAQVLVIDKLTYAGNLASLAPVSGHARFEFLQRDIADAPAMAAALAAFRPDTIFHLAAESHVDRSLDGPAEFVHTNLVGTYVLLEAARHYHAALDRATAGRFRFIHVSTDEVFGALGTDGQFTEATAYAPTSPYSATKAGSDHLARAWHHSYGLPVIVSNCSNNYGPYHFPEKLIPLTILNAIEGKPLPVYGRGLNVRDWLYVDDHAAALARIGAAGRIGETYLIGGRSERSNIDLVTMVCALLDRHRPDPAGPHQRLITFVADRPGHDLRYAIDCSKLERELGWRPAETIESGLEKTVAWYLARRDWWEPIRSGRYGGERLGLAKPTGTPG